MHVRNARVETKRIVTTAERPKVNIVHFLHAFDGENGAGDIFDAHFMRATFEKEVGRFAQEADGKAKKRIDPMRASGADDERADDNGDIGESVTEIVNENAA